MDASITVDPEMSPGRSLEIHALCTEVVRILVTASRELDHSHEAARVSIRHATSLLQARIGPAAQMQAPLRIPVRRGLLAWQARRVTEYIEQHLDAPVSVADLGKLVKLSEAHFSRAFRRAFGEPPHAYLVRRRIGLATRLMVSSDAPLSEIAVRCGFNDQAHLSKQFRHFLGESPAAWRRSQRSGQEIGGARSSAGQYPALRVVNGCGSV